MGVILLCAVVTPASPGGSSVPRDSDPVEDGIRQAADAGKYAVVIFHRQSDPVLETQKNVQAALKDALEQVEILTVDVEDKASAKTVQTYGVQQAPMPLILVIAPNGAVTGGFQGSFEPDALKESLASRNFASCIKSIQEGKLVFIAIGGTNAAATETALTAVNEMMADPRFKDYSAMIKLQPHDTESRDLLVKLNVPDSEADPVTVMLAPPGRIIGSYKGVVSKDQMVNDLIRAMSGSTCGGGGGGCGPRSRGCGI